jgi:AraC-like DNA-binding protein
MTLAPEVLTGKPDLLSDVLARVRLSGAIFLRGEYSAPWALDSPESHELLQLLAPGAKRLILFHIVREGSCWVSARGERVEMRAGDVAVLPFADRHLMGSPGYADAIPIAQLLPPPPWDGVPTCRFEGGGANTSVVCGYLKCDDLLFNPMLRLLPPLFRVRPQPGPAEQWMHACVQYALDENVHRRPGGASVMARLPELLFIEALRLYANGIPANATGWLAAMKDPVVGHALAHMHAEPAHRWSVTELATRSFTSRSVLDDRFRKLLGCSPIRYLTEWRLQLAADLMRGGRIKLADVAQRVGYESEEAFSRAFRRHVGQSPGQWRA